MSDMQNNGIPIRKKRKNRKRSFGYFYLFAFVFLIALLGISYIVKSYSPDIDVAIGNNEALTLSESDMEVEIKSVDERLKWIQMEDEMPTVAVREPERKKNKNTFYDEDDSSGSVENIKKEAAKKEESKIKKPPVPVISDINKDFRTQTLRQVIPQPKPALTKVYLGSYSSIEEAIIVQNKISADEPALNPFIKAVGNTFVVQLGSFSDSDKAKALVVNLRERGYSPKVTYEN